ncbi:hypothetical protein [uncultured Bacteroides sp.]|uniref:DUF7033 domain-containing protein n=1 Tax=uncultured Bacteroides sp. TaxID=162156 RepID=UPI00261F2007|nr:hypothetical protein [uncultured Bacteroides sp.]
MALQIYCNKDNIAERTWIINVFFSEFLKTDYQLHFIDTDCYEVRYGEKKIVFADSFFRYHSKPLEYLSKDSFPKDICFSEFQVSDKKIPIVILYGKDELLLEQSMAKCSADLFASAYFMLSRWEEYCIDEKDSYGTCDERQLLSVRYSFFRRPVVNEYIELIRALFSLLGFPVEGVDRKPQIYFTYDVDDLFFTGIRKWKHVVRALGGDLIRRKNLNLFFQRLCFYVCTLGKDLYVPFNDLLHLNSKAYTLFFFKAQVIGELGATYDSSDKRLKPLFAKIRQAGGHIGLHSSEIAYNDKKQLDKEIGRMNEKLEPNAVVENRNHLLLYDINLLDYLSEKGIYLDSSFGFHYRNGFRCGICQRFPMFNYLSRRSMKVYQLPFSIKDNGSFYLDKSVASMRNDILSMLHVIEHYRGDVISLWHTNKLNTFEMRQYRKVFIRIFAKL